MTSDDSQGRAGPSRRALLRYGTIATASGVLGTPYAKRAVASADPSPDDSLRGVMYPYQYAPGTWTIGESSLDWRPRRLDSSYRTYVVTSERSRSFRAFVFTEDDLSRRSGSVALTAASPPDGASTPRSLVDVELAFER